MVFYASNVAPLKWLVLGYFNREKNKKQGENEGILEIFAFIEEREWL
jgi:hypothetical protein